MYPVPFRRLEEKQQYAKYDWVECELARNKSDPRPETYRPVDEAQLVAVGHIDPTDKWRERRKLLLKTARVYDRLDDLIAEAKANTSSLAVFKPNKVIDFIWEDDERQWNPDRVREMREASQ